MERAELRAWLDWQILNFLNNLSYTNVPTLTQSPPLNAQNLAFENLGFQSSLSHKIQNLAFEYLNTTAPIISLTTYPARIDTLHYTLYTLFTQSLKPKRVLLWLSKEEFENQESLPPLVKGFCAAGLEICWCEGNIKSYKKLIYTLKAYPHDVIVTADDDALYHTEWLERLYRAYREDSHSIHCHRAHRIAFDKQGKILPYLKWNLNVSYQQTMPSFLNLPTGVGGILYPPFCPSSLLSSLPLSNSYLDSENAHHPLSPLYKDIMCEEKFLALCPLGDDFWFWAMALLQGTKINLIKDNLSMHSSFVDIAQTGALWLENTKEYNDIYLSNLLTHYPLLRERVEFSSSEYWEIRYKSFMPKKEHKNGVQIGASGAGSYGRLAKFKAEFLNDFVKKHHVEFVLEWGCGDGNQLGLSKYPRYVGIDVSPSILESVRNRFKNDTSKTFYLSDEYMSKPEEKADLSLSLDVIFHLIEDSVFETYMERLFDLSKKFVIIYSSNKDEYATQHVRHRRFSEWIKTYRKQWKLYQVLKNPYPYDVNAPNESSFCDFYVYSLE